MAMFDGIRERMRGQRPVGAAEEMQRNAQPGGGFGGQQQYGMEQDGSQRRRGSRYPLQHNQQTEEELESLQRGMSPEEHDAFLMGQRMGAESLLELKGQSVPGRDDAGRIMTKERLNSAMNTLLRYRAGKASVNRRIINAQEWWKMNNWQQIKLQYGHLSTDAAPKSTGWLWNSIVGKHADAVDSYPEPIILPRAEDDKSEAKKLSSIIPVILKMNGFEETYSQAMWQKMQEGTGAYGIFWDSRKLNGLGDICIKKINMLNLYWEPGIGNIQDSRNLFYVTYEDVDELMEMYPQLEGKAANMKLFVDKYKTDDNIDMSNKAVVVDWYYKKYLDGKTVLHYCKFVGENCLYSSEEEAQTPNQDGTPNDLAQGYYHDGEYPFVLDPLFPVEGSPAGYGYIDIGVGEQAGLDLLDDAMTINTIMHAIPRYFERKDSSINRDQFMNWREPIVTAGANLGQDSLRPIEVPEMGASAFSMLQHKVDAIKFITGNTDINNGGVPSGVTAASAIAALKEDSGRSSKDSTKAAYRAFTLIVNMVIERIRQFYDIPRVFRIIGKENMQEQFESYNNAGLQIQQTQNLPGQAPGLRLPVFDIDIRPQRENAYTQMAQNELGIQFWGMGMFNPQMTDQAVMLLDMMEFKGKDELKRRIMEQGTMRDTLVQVAQIALQLATQYDPAAAEQLAVIIQGISADMGAQIGAGGGAAAGRVGLQSAPDDAMSAPHDARENQIVRRAGERAANASRPD